MSLDIGGHPFKVVDSISFDLHRGRTLAIVGESGCGKTMTALALMQILPQPPALPAEGEVWYGGRNLLTLQEAEMRRLRGSKIAMIFQDPSTALNPVYTIGSQLSEVAELHLNLYGDDALDKAEQALAEVGIAAPRALLDVYPHQLSGGMKQRVMIAMALLCEPDVLIADEPTTALDVTIQAQVLDLMRALQSRKGMALLLITHDMNVVAEMAQEVAVMYASQVIERGEVLQIFNKRSHPYTMGLFNSRPNLHSPRGSLKAITGSVPPLTHYPSGCRFHPRCPFAMQKCKHGSVPSFPIEPQHTANCWLHDGTEESKQKRPP